METPGSTPRPEEAAQPGRTAPQTVPGAQVTGTGHLVRHLAGYTALRLGLVVVLTAALAFFMPLIVALLFAIIVQLPLAWLLFSGPRRRVNDAIAVSTAHRRQERGRLQSALSGEPVPQERPTAGGPPTASDAMPGSDPVS